MKHILILVSAMYALGSGVAAAQPAQKLTIGA
jgi:hypothetical protein